MSTFSDQIILWHRQHGRHDLPWQGTRDPYKIWVSEIMLQQTQVSTVIPYFARFMQRFPTVSSLAQADIDEVLHLWTGLGYYARGRNLHKAAQQIVKKFDGQFPKNIDDMMSLSGIGRSTAGAILSFAFSLRHPILDGNVKRVLSRVFEIEGWYGQATIAKIFWDFADKHTPEQEVEIYTQAIMDFGATLCKRSKPLCEQCPIQTDCIAFQKQRTTELPTKKPKKKIPSKACQMVIIRNSEGHILLEQRPPAGIWGGLWCFPQFEIDDDIQTQIKKEHGIDIDLLTMGAKVKHTFSHYHLDIHTFEAQLKNNNGLANQTADSNLLWLNNENEVTVGLPAPIKKLLAKI